MSTELPSIVGLTGGIASGKSTVTDSLVALGARVIDADVIARAVVATGSPGLAEIKRAFGDQIIAQDGSLDRKALGQIIFDDPEARKRLNQITHPLIALEMLKRAQTAGGNGYSWVVYDAALIVESGIQSMLNGLIVVSCSPLQQRNRLIARDALGAKEADARIASQLPLADKVAVADWVIDNGGTIQETREQVQALFEQLQRDFGSEGPDG